MKLILLRHATRDLGFKADSSLNLAGQIMAQNLVEKIGHILPVPNFLFTSPKKRAQETLIPMAQSLRLPLQIETRLDERHNAEDAHTFYAQIKSYLHGLPTEFADDAVVLLCSHSDWLEEAAFCLSRGRGRGNFACAESRIYNFDGRIWSEQND